MKIERRISPEEIGHEFLKYILKNDIRNKILGKLDKKIYLTTGIEDKKYDKFLEQEYLAWVKKVDAPRDLREAGWESYRED